ncbi:MFS transporter [Rickettsiella grylli]|uniref:Transporter n=1 Tax=Rickettsiella grylli TaxID=59196 RepID=A8PMU8_9COXI|nr:MFS transporter [Rickettsiella grylli]EDP45930.1 putative transporter [Rickettsiella grylli]
MLKLTENNRKWWILLAMSTSLSLIFIDQTALVVALPAIQRELNLTSSLTQWVINAYLLTLSTFILLGGKIGDRWGHKRAFLLGVIVFLMGSVGCALSHSSSWLILLRGLQGIGGALMMPSTNALITNAFPDKERGRALGMYVALAAIFLALGPLLGGFLTQFFDWRAVFWINVPIALISIILAFASVPGWTRTEKLNIDWLGFFISTLFISSFVLSFMEGSHWGWTSPSIVGLLFFSFISLGVFIVWETHHHHPFVELDLFKNSTFSILFSILLMIQSVGIIFVFWSLFLQNILHYTPLKAGLFLLPAMLPLIFMAPIGGHLRDRYGPKKPMSWGALLVILSLIWIGIFSHHQRYVLLLPGFLGFGIGMPLILSGIMATAMTIVGTQQRGIASALLNGARQLGTSMGLAVLAGLLSSVNKWQLSFRLKHYMHSFSLKESQIDGLLAKSKHAMRAVNHLSVENLAWLKHTMTISYVTAFSFTMFVAAFLVSMTFALIFKIPSQK